MASASSDMKLPIGGLATLLLLVHCIAGCSHNLQSTNHPTSSTAIKTETESGAAVGWVDPVLSKQEAVDTANDVLFGPPNGLPKVEPLGVLELSDFYVVAYPVLLPGISGDRDSLTEVWLPREKGESAKVVSPGMSKTEFRKRMKRGGVNAGNQ